MGYEQCCYFEVCKHRRGNDLEDCKIMSICKHYKDSSLEPETQERDEDGQPKKRKYTRRPGSKIGRPPKQLVDAHENI